MSEDNDDIEFTEREKAIIEMSLFHFLTDAHVNGEFDVAGDGRRVANKVGEWRDDDAQDIGTGL